MSYRKTPSIRRIMADVRELAEDPSDQYAARPNDTDMFDWHFTIRGPKGTDFEGGVYHGRIILPPDYPFKPPNIMLLTPNGRWEVRKKVCLSISAHHPEHWQPAWGIRTILEALISFMTAPADGSLGALDYPSSERKRLAILSKSYSHPLMPELPEEQSADETASKSEKYKQQIKQMHLHSVTAETEVKSSPESEESTPMEQSEASSVPESTSNVSPPVIQPIAVNAQLNIPASRVAPAAEQVDYVDNVLFYTAVALGVALFAILYRKALLTFGLTHT